MDVPEYPVGGFDACDHRAFYGLIGLILSIGHKALGSVAGTVQMSPMPRFVGGKSLEEQFGTLWWIARALFQTDSVTTEVRYSSRHCIGYKRNFKEKLI
jgi:hypothetical protein